MTLYHALALILTALLTVNATDLASKQSSNITIAFVGPYRWYPGIKTQNRLVISGYESLNLSSLSDPQYIGSMQGFFWLQAAAQIAVTALNTSPSILPNTTIKIKRFDILTPRGEYTSGSAMQTAHEIATNHKDVVAVFGELYSENTVNAYLGNTDQIAKTLAKNGARYIFMCMSQTVTADVYFSLAFTTTPRLVDENHVFIASNPPVPASNARAIQRWGPQYAKAARGILIVQATNGPTNYSARTQEYLKQEVNALQAPW
ncbi:UNVERIFIED_CONTAM: hypothetical protein HDU68_004095, partial [Siphonaria sp. JEL0065]